MVLPALGVPITINAGAHAPLKLSGTELALGIVSQGRSLSRKQEYFSGSEAQRLFNAVVLIALLYSASL